MWISGVQAAGCPTPSLNFLGIRAQPPRKFDERVNVKKEGGIGEKEGKLSNEKNREICKITNHSGRITPQPQPKRIPYFSSRHIWIRLWWIKVYFCMRMSDEVQIEGAAPGFWMSCCPVLSSLLNYPPLLNPELKSCKRKVLIVEGSSKQVACAWRKKALFG